MGRFSGKTCRLLSMLFLTSSFFLVEIIVGYVTNSLALVADSFHMLSDVVALIVGFASIRISKWPSRQNTYGWVRAEILGALVNAVFLLALCFSILVESLKRLVTVEEIEKPVLLLIVGSVGLLVNIVGLLLFHSQVHGHSHGGGSHSHGHKSKDESKSLVKHGTNGPNDAEQGKEVIIEMDVSATAKERESSSEALNNSESQMNMKGVFLHVLGDALGSVVVVVSSLVIWLAEGRWRFYIDPAMSIAMVLIILSTTIPLLKQSSLILLQTAPNFVDHDKLKQKLVKVEGVLGVHEFHVWQLAGNRIVLSAHITCSNLREYMTIAAYVKDLFHKEGIHSTTIQPEFISVSDDELHECRLPCVDKNLDCSKDVCCAPSNSTPKTKASKGRRIKNNKVPEGAQHTIQEVSESALSVPSSNQTTDAVDSSAEDSDSPGLKDVLDNAESQHKNSVAV